MNLCSPAPCNIPWHLWPRSLFWQRHRMLQIPRWGQRTPSLEPCTAEGHPFPSIWKSGTFINHLARNLKPAHWMIGLQWNIAHCGTLSFWDEARCLVGKRHMFGPKTLDTTGRAEFVREKRNSIKQLTKPRKVSCKIPQKSRLCGKHIKCSSLVHQKCSPIGQAHQPCASWEKYQHLWAPGKCPLHKTDLESQRRCECCMKLW